MGGKLKTKFRFPILEGGSIAVDQIFLGSSARPLNSEEKKLLLSIFGDSIDLDPVRLAITPLGKGVAYTLGNNINIARDIAFTTDKLVHEMTHVWQYQTQGTAYISDSVTHRLTQGKAATYAINIIPGKSFYGYTAEQQAVIVQSYYLDNPPGFRQDPDVAKMIGELQQARPIPAAAIERETWFGHFRDIPEDPAKGRDSSFSPTVPLLRIEWDWK